MSHCGTSAFYYHFSHGFIVLKDIQRSIGTRRCSVWWNVINLGQIEIGVRGWNLFFHVWLSVCRQVSPWLSSTAGIPPMRRPASSEMTSASVELCETEICFLHIQLVGPNVRLPKMHRIHLLLISSLQGLLQNQRLETIRVCTVVLCFPQSNIACVHMCDECKRSNAPNVCHMLLSILWPHEQVCSQTTRYRVYQFETNSSILELFVSIRLTTLQQILFSSLNWRSSMHGVATLFYCCVVLFASSQYLSTHFFTWPSMS